MTLNKYTCGTAILQSPFFFLAHLYCKIFGCSLVGKATANIPYLGYSITHATFIWIAAVTYAYLALVILYKVLRKWFGKPTSFIAVIVIYWGTNLFYYVLCCPGYSHVYSFFVLCLFVYRLDKFFIKTNFRNAAYCGIPLGLAILIRPTNIFYVLLFLLWDVYSLQALRSRFAWIVKNIKYFLLTGFMVFIVFIPQVLYWHAVAGKYFVYAYIYSANGEERFIYWKSPKIAEVLFSVESGWLIYSPVFFFFIIGLIYAFFKKSAQWPGVLILLLLILYANASWWAYTFSCSFGHRAFIEYYPLLIIPIAFLFQKILDRKRKFMLYSVGFLIVIFSFVNFRMSYLYYHDPCWVRPRWTWESYNKLLNKVFYIIPQSRHLK